MHMHDHDHSHHSATTPEQQLALLSYMVEHNKSHTDELHDLAHALEGEAADLLHEAVSLYDQGNKKLARALELLKEKEA
ncbi:MAG: hypothetical protein SOV74_06975 [Coriobacteriales bacterium]|nr:hypothetical protein [Coriobacteriales bacterium]